MTNLFILLGFVGIWQILLVLLILFLLFGVKRIPKMIEGIKQRVRDIAKEVENNNSAK